MNRSAVVACLGALLSSAVLAQATAPSPNSQPPLPDLGKLFAQTFSDKDLELIADAMRDGLRGKPADAAKLAPLAQRMEGLAHNLLSQLLTAGLPMIDELEAELKRELRKSRESTR
jgi:hypothetical protein